MAELHRCPQCGAEVPADAPQGLCPNCVLKAGMGTQQTGSFSQSDPGSASASSSEARFVPPTPAELAPHFPDLEILEFVGQGGMGMVYKARQKRLDRLVALKILSPKIGQDPGFAARFQREARAMAMLSHPHIVAVYDFDQTPSLPSPVPAEAGHEAGSTLPSFVLGRGAGGEGLYYFLMEFIDGVNLRQLLSSGKLAQKEALAIVPQICDALQYAHDHGVVHRDIKPENLLLAKSGEVKIADFGLAKLVGQGAEDLTLSGAGHVLGTPQYMAPEQIEHPLEVDHRADIYSLGVVFYQMLTGELPIGRFAPPSKKVQIDVRLDEVVLRALEKEPERRYQQASEVRTEVETIVSTARLGVGTKASRFARATAVAIAVTRWSSRILGTLMLLGLALFIFGEGMPSIASQPAPVRVEFVGFFLMALGMVVGWKWEGWAALLILAGEAEFHIVEGKLLLPGALNLPLIVAALYGACWWMQRVSASMRRITSDAGAATGLSQATPTTQAPEPPGLNRQALKQARRALEKEPEPFVPRVSRHAVWGTAWAAFAVTFVLMKILGGGPAQFDALEKLARILSLAALPVVPILGARALLEIRHSGGQVLGLGWALFDLLAFPLLGLNALIGFTLYWGWASMGGGAFGPGGPGWAGVVIPILILSLIIDFLIARWAWRAAKPPAGSGDRPHEPPVSTSPAAHPKPLRWHAGWFTVAAAALLAAFFGMPNFFRQSFINAPPGAINPNAGQPAKDESADASQRPQLRFLAWQSGNDRTKEVSVAWKPGGDPLLSANDKQLLAHLPPDYKGPRTGANSDFLDLWFSSPRLDSGSFFKVQLLDETGHPIQSDAGRSEGGYARSPAQDDQNLGWIVATAGTGKRGKALTAVNVILHYSSGDWKRGPWASSDFSGLTVAPLDDHTLVSGVGQAADGKAFVTVTRIDAAPPTTQFAFIAVTPDGKQVNSDETAQRGAGDTLTELFVFPTPLANVKTFISRQRAIHTIEFKNVSLPPREKTDEHIPHISAPGTPAPVTGPEKPAEAPASAAHADPLQSPRAAQMRTIVFAALEYATEHGEWPMRLDELQPRHIDAGKIDLSQFVYHPLSPEASETNPQGVAVLTEKAPAPAGGQLVGFADGYVEFIKDSARLKRLLPGERESPSPQWEEWLKQEFGPGG